MSHVISLATTGAINMVIDLRRVDQTGAVSGGGFYKAVKLRCTAIQNGGAAAKFVIAPIVVADDATPPAATTLNVAQAAPLLCTTLLDSTANQSIELGNAYSPGYTPNVFREIVATHVMVTHVAGGIIQIVVD